MISCVNTKAPEFRRFQQLTGLSESDLKLAIARYQADHNGNWPESVDEIPGANTEQYFNQEFELSRYNSTDVESVLEKTESQSIPEAISKINYTYNDVVTDYTVIQDRIEFDRIQLPSPHRFNYTEAQDHSDVESTGFIIGQLERLGKLYGIQTKQVTTKELALMGILAKVPEAAQVSAFILNGDIYVNVDNASINSGAHELMHVFMGSIKYKYPDLYQQLVETVLDLKDVDTRAVLYSGRTQSDILEEIFVEEYSKYLAGLDSYLSNIDPEIRYKVDHNISKMLDVILMGDNSVEVIPANLRFGESLRNVGKLVNSKSMVNEGMGFIDSATLHRIMGNLKSKLMKSGDLKEECV